MQRWILALVGCWTLALLLGGNLNADDAKAEPKKTAVEKADAKADEALIKADSAWMLVSTALVMLMIPGLALFYGGMVRRKNVLSTMMQSMVCLSVVGVYWIAIGYCLDRKSVV